MCQPGGHADTIGDAEGQNINAELKYAPKVLAANETYSPEYTRLGLNNLYTYLNGSNGSDGYLGEYTSKIAPAAAAATTMSNTAVRQGNMADVNALIPQMTTATRTANPGAANLVDKMTSNASNDLGYGTGLNSQQKTLVQQSVRGGQAARGLGTGSSDATNEAFAQTDYGQQLYQQRLNNANSASSSSQNFYGNIIPTILGTSANMSTAQNLSSTGTSNTAPSMMSEFNPGSNMASDEMGQSTQVSMANSEERTGAISKGLGSLGSGMSSGYM